MKNQIKTFGQFINESRTYGSRENRNRLGVHENIMGPSNKDLQLRMVDLIRQIDDLLEELELTDADLYNSIDSVLKQAKEHKYDGTVDIQQGRTGRIVLLFKPTPSKFHQSNFYKNFAEPLTQGLRKFQ